MASAPWLDRWDPALRQGFPPAAALKVDAVDSLPTVLTTGDPGGRPWLAEEIGRRVEKMAADKARVLECRQGNLVKAVDSHLLMRLDNEQAVRRSPAIKTRVSSQRPNGLYNVVVAKDVDGQSTDFQPGTTADSEPCFVSNADGLPLTSACTGVIPPAGR